jgi:hypothetical protein
MHRLSFSSNFDNAIQRVKYWTSSQGSGNASPANALSPTSSTSQLVGFGSAMAAVSTPGVISDGISGGSGAPTLSSGQRKRIRSYMKRCRLHSRHSQLNLEGYLLLPVQRIPRYRLLVFYVVFSTDEVWLIHSWRSSCAVHRRRTITEMIIWIELWQRYRS